MQLKQAQRKQVKIKLGLQGPSGSGKTYSALLLAFGMLEDWNKIVVIDTENHSSELYSHLGNYNVLSLEAPFTPERYILAINTCIAAGMQIIIIDSISHEWEGKGGVLEFHSNMTGNSFTNWHKITPRHNAFIQAILQAPVHIIATIRSKQDYVLSEKNGKIVPEKVGLKGIQRDGMDYELTIVLNLDIKHNAVASKDRTGLFMDKPQFVISKETGMLIKDWCFKGVSVDHLKNQVMSATSIEDLLMIYNNHPEYKNDLYPLIIKKKEVLQPTNGELKK